MNHEDRINFLVPSCRLGYIQESEDGDIITIFFGFGKWAFQQWDVEEKLAKYSDMCEKRIDPIFSQVEDMNIIIHI